MAKGNQVQYVSAVQRCNSTTQMSLMIIARITIQYNKNVNLEWDKMWVIKPSHNVHRIVKPASR